MNQPHKHKDAIIAWANGEQIEYYSESYKAWRECDSPSWLEFDKYRVKPKEVTRQFQVALFKYERSIYTSTADNSEQTKMLESLPNFVGWLTEPISYQVEEMN